MYTSRCRFFFSQFFSVNPDWNTFEIAQNISWTNCHMHLTPPCMNLWNRLTFQKIQDIEWSVDWSLPSNGQDLIATPKWAKTVVVGESVSRSRLFQNHIIVHVYLWSIKVCKILQKEKQNAKQNTKYFIEYGAYPGGRRPGGGSESLI